MGTAWKNFGRMRTILLLPLLLALVECQQVRQQFDEFKVKFNKTYSSSNEEETRFKIFASNLVELELTKTKASYSTGVTQFFDLTREEFRTFYLGRVKRPNPGVLPKADAKASKKSLPTSMDWREHGVVSAVKNQGQCGSCWAFATTEMVESYAAIATGSLLELSTQQVTSCSPNPLNCGGVGGCRGSIAQLGFGYLQLFGHTTEESWPYTSGSTTETGDCTFDMEATAPAVTLAGYDTLPPNDQDAVLSHLAEVGPLAVNVDASQWHSYTGGIFDGCDYAQNMDLNHVVQMVGYTEDAWIVRNSWGTGWGEDGYIRLARGDQCGTDSKPLDGTGCVNGPGSDVQHVCGQCGVLFDTSYPLGAKLA